MSNYAEYMLPEIKHYTGEHVNELYQFLFNYIEQNKYNIIRYYRNVIADMVRNAIHYEWYFDIDMLDYSGELVDCGEVDYKQTVLNFLEKEFTGVKVLNDVGIAKYRWVTYFDEYQRKFEDEISENVFADAMRKYVWSEHFSEINDSYLFELVDFLIKNYDFDINFFKEKLREMFEGMDLMSTTLTDILL